MKNSKKNTNNTFEYGVDKTKINLIKHYMAEKGLDSSQFDEEYRVQLGKLIDKMYRKYVPSEVRKLLETPAFSISSNPTAMQAAETTKESETNGRNEEIRADNQ